MQSLSYESADFHPMRSPPSVQLPESIRSGGFAVPPDLLPPNGSLSNGFTISIYFRKTSLEDNVYVSNTTGLPC